VVNLNAPVSASGNGQINYSVGANAGTNARFMSIATADWLHNIAQLGTASNQVFTDVPTNHLFFLFIAAMQQRDITRGWHGDGVLSGRDGNARADGGVHPSDAGRG